MSDLSKYLGRGLLVLALSGSVFACGDDDDDNPPDDEDAGAGRSGSGGGGRGGSSGAGRGGSGGSGGADGGVTEAECLEMTEDNTGGMVSDACAECLCDDSPDETAACNATCWGLISCFAAECAGVTPGTDEGSMCAIANCMPYLGGASTATPLGMIIRAECPDVCATAADDAGTEDGGT